MNDHQEAHTMPRHEHTARHHADEYLDLPENHLDVVVTTGSVDPGRRAKLITQIVAVVLLPLFLMTGFTIAYNSAQHAPVPHDMALTIAGPTATTRAIADAIEQKAAGAFDITQTTSAAKAQQAVENRDAVGAVVIEGTHVTTIVASAAGRIAVGPIQQVGQQVATRLGGTATVKDVAPVDSEDTSGTALFYFLIMCTVGGYLSITVITQVIRKPRARTMVATAAGAAILSPIIGYAMLSLFVGDLGAGFGPIAGVIGVGMIYTFAVGLIATFLTQALGQGAIFAVLILLMFLNFPSTGGSAPESMLPGFWQFIHNTWIGSGAFESMRSISYFGGHQFGRWFGQLAIWAGVALAATLAISVAQHRRRATADNPENDEPAMESEELVHTAALS